MKPRTAFLAGLLAVGLAPPGHAQDALNVGGFSNDANQLDPHRSTAAQDSHVFSLMFNGLVRFGPGSTEIDSIEPDLAESWEASDDGLVWTFTLREGVPFHGDRGTLTAEDVVYSLERAADPERSSFSSKYVDMESVEAVDERTVRVTLARPVPSLLGLVADYQGGYVVSKAAGEELGDEFRTNPVGTGPFAFDEYRPQQALILEGFDEYFRGEPALERIVYRYIDSDSTRQLAFRSGEVDMFYGRRDQGFVDQMKDVDEARVEVFAPAQSRVLHINTSKPPLDQLEVRQAIMHAIDTDELRESVGVDITTDSPSVIPNGYLGWTDDVPSYEFDQDKARALLEEAGFPDGFSTTAIISQLSTLLEPMQVVQEQLRRVGIDVELEIVDHPNFLPRIRQNESPLVFYGAARFPTADAFLTEFYSGENLAGPGSGGNNWSQCTMADEDIIAARSEADAGTRAELWKAAQVKLLENACAKPLFELAQVWVVRDNIELGYEFDGALGLGPLVTPETRFAE